VAESVMVVGIKKGFSVMNCTGCNFNIPDESKFCEEQRPM